MNMCLRQNRPEQTQNTNRTADEEETKMAGTRELNKAEMAHVSGGWEYDGKREWLRGNEISCPYCNNDSREIVVFRASLGASNAAFSCEDCRRF